VANVLELNLRLLKIEDLIATEMPVPSERWHAKLMDLESVIEFNIKSVMKISSQCETHHSKFEMLVKIDNQNTVKHDLMDRDPQIDSHS
jgi:hypothetical protein